jgi:hypothetical protein
MTLLTDRIKTTIATTVQGSAHRHGKHDKAESFDIHFLTAPVFIAWLDVFSIHVCAGAALSEGGTTYCCSLSEL